jgi:autotransporter passenger strand-loop-strand repeat protein
MVSSGGIASATIIATGGTETVYAGGKDDTASVYGAQNLSGSTASGAVIYVSGVESVYTGGLTTGTVISSGGVETVYTGGSTSATVISAIGTAYVSSGGLATGSIVRSGGIERIMSSGAGHGSMISNGGTQVISSGGAVSGTIVSSGGLDKISAGGRDVAASIYGNLAVSGGVASAAVVNSAGVETVYAGGVASGASVHSGGELIVSSGGVASGAVILSGGIATLAGSMGAGQGLGFAGSGSELVVSSTGVMSANISGFALGDEIDLKKFAYSTAVTSSYTGKTTSGTLKITSAGSSVSLAFVGDYVAANFKLSSDSAGGVMIKDPPVGASSAQPHQLVAAMASFTSPGPGQDNALFDPSLAGKAIMDTMTVTALSEGSRHA